METTYRQPIMTINGYLLDLEIDLGLEMFADRSQEVIECVVELVRGFLPRSTMS